MFCNIITFHANTKVPIHIMRHTMLKSRFLGGVAFSAALLSAPVAQAATEVVTSIKPLELLVRAVATDDVQVTSLVPSGASPHNYSMRPSQRQALERADAIFWVGPSIETFLERLLEGQDFRNRSVALMAEHDDGDEEGHDDHHGHDRDNHDEADEHHAGAHDDHGHDDHGHDHHGHDHGDGEDPHIWLDPILALDMARDIHRVLSAQPGANTEGLDARLADFEKTLLAAEEDIQNKLEAARQVSLFTYHDAFSRFAEHYGLVLEGVLTLNPERSPGARHIAEVQQKLRKANQPCLLTEPQFNRQWWRSITEGLDITFSTWDPLASDVEPNAEGYVKFQYALADAVLECLPENAKQ